MGEEVEITTKSPSRIPSVPLLCTLPHSLCAFPRISAPVSIPPWRIALTWQFEREEPRGAMLRPRLLSGLFVCLFPGIECRLSSFCSWVFSPALFLILSIPPDVIRHLPHPLVPLLSTPPRSLCAFPASRPLFLFRRMLSGIPSSLCIPPASLREP